MLVFVNPVMLPFLIAYVNDPYVPDYAGAYLTMRKNSSID